MSNDGVPPRVDQVPRLEEDANDYKPPVNPPPLKDGDIRSTFH